MAKLIIASLLSLFSFNVSSRSPSIIYSMDDIKALDNQKAHQELIDHIFDIKPGKRDLEWKNILTKNATKLIEDFINKKNFEAKNLKIINKLIESKYFNDQEIFLIRRKDYLKQYFEDCFQADKMGQNTCEKDLKTAITLSPRKIDFPEVSTELALTLKKYVPETNLYPYFKNTITQAQGLKYCRHPFILSEILQKIEIIMSTSESSKKEVISKTNNLMGSECLEVVKNHLIENMASIFSLSKQTSYYYWLRDLDLLSERASRKFEVYFFLQGLGPGKLLNKTWGTIKGLSRNHKYRELLVEDIKKFDPIPDEFLNKDELVRQTYLRHLDNNFPEFIQHYNQSCQAFFQGRGHFPKGNPTVHCRQFLKELRNLKGSNHLGVKNLERSLRL